MVILNIAQLIALYMGAHPYKTVGIQTHTTNVEPILDKLGIEYDSGRIHYMTNQHKIGVFLCHCGGNISDVLKLDKIEKQLIKNNEVVSIKHHENLCSLEGRKIIKDQILRKSESCSDCCMFKSNSWRNISKLYKTIKSILI